MTAPNIKQTDRVGWGNTKIQAIVCIILRRVYILNKLFANISDGLLATKSNPVIKNKGMFSKSFKCVLKITLNNIVGIVYI